MVESDFYKLHIDQKVWYKGEEVTVRTLKKLFDGVIRIYFNKEHIGYDFLEIMHDLSFEPPKKKKRYWLWSIKEGDEYYKSLYYYDDDGLKTNDTRGLLDWHDLEKIKHEDEWIEVEE